MCEQEWSFLHVWDFYTAISKILESKPNKIINVGNPETVKISYLVNMIGELTGRKDLLKIGAKPYRSDQVMFLKPECTILKHLGWNPEVDLMSGLTHMIESEKSKSEIYLSLKNNSKILI
jgi:nucleoside-diphosphate-sugar epimerase